MWVSEQVRLAKEGKKAGQEKETRRFESEAQQEGVDAKARLELKKRQAQLLEETSYVEAKQRTEERERQQRLEQEKLVK